MFYFVSFTIVFLFLCFYALYFVALLVILSLLLITMGHSFLAARLSFTFHVYIYFSWQINSDVAAAKYKDCVA